MVLSDDVSKDLNIKRSKALLFLKVPVSRNVSTSQNVSSSRNAQPIFVEHVRTAASVSNKITL